MTEKTTTNPNGKGSKPRPLATDYNTYAENYDRIFGKKKKQEKNDDSESE